MKIAFLSVRLKLLFWFAAISLLPLALAGWIVSGRAGKIIRESIKSQLNTSAQGIKGNVSAFIEEKKNETVNFCSDGIIKDGLTFYDPDDPGVDALIKSTNHHIAKNKMSLDSSLEDILILNLKGRVVFATNEKNSGKEDRKSVV